jgi:hypothetical protein
MVSCPYARHHIRGALLPGFSRASGLRDQLEIQRTQRCDCRCPKGARRSFLNRVVRVGRAYVQDP